MQLALGLDGDSTGPKKKRFAETRMIAAKGIVDDTKQLGKKRV